MTELNFYRFVMIVFLITGSFFAGRWHAMQTVWPSFVPSWSPANSSPQANSGFVPAAPMHPQSFQATAAQMPRQSFPATAAINPGFPSCQMPAPTPTLQTPILPGNTSFSQRQPESATPSGILLPPADQVNQFTPQPEVELAGDPAVFTPPLLDSKDPAVAEIMKIQKQLGGSQVAKILNPGPVEKGSARFDEDVLSPNPFPARSAMDNDSQRVFLETIEALQSNLPIDKTDPGMGGLVDQLDRFAAELELNDPQKSKAYTQLARAVEAFTGVHQK